MSDFHFSPRPNRAAEIRWRAWGEAAFEEARAESKPVLLAISAVWCHWCHVMDETTYSSDDVISTINRRYVPIRVDNDQRPDINARYNQGGWPTTAILTPTGDILKGATYVPPEQMHQLLTQVSAFYDDPENRAAVAARTSEMRARRETAETGVPRGAQLGEPVAKPDIPDRVFSFLDANFDERYGGFGTDQKFPHTAALHFLLDRWMRTRDDRTRDIVVRTLHAMADGGMYDRVHGGFYRYSTTRDFSVPHFEKMLEDLGGLLLACARAAAMFDDGSLGRIAIEVRAYLDAHLWNLDVGGYGGSQDADESYYALDAKGREALAEPYVDPTIYTSWNAETARALIIAGPLLSRCGADAREWTDRGVSVLETLWAKLRSDDLMYRFFDDAPHIRGLLADQASSAWAMLTAYEASGTRHWIERAMAIVEAADALYATQASAYADRLDDGDASGRLGERAFPMDDNALMARVLMKLGVFTEQPRYRDRADAVLATFADAYRGYGMFAAAYGAAALDRFSPALDVVIVGDLLDPNGVSLREAARRVATVPVLIDSVDPKNAPPRVAAMGQTNTDGAVAFVCDAQACRARVKSARELEAAVSQPVSAAKP